MGDLQERRDLGNFITIFNMKTKYEKTFFDSNIVNILEKGMLLKLVCIKFL